MAADTDAHVSPVDLDDLESVRAADPGGMLDAVASAGEQVRQALVACEQSGVVGVRHGGRPRAVVVTGMGGSGIAGHVLQAAAGPECPVPVERVRGWTLPAWVGADDLVIAVSSSGRTAETMACTRTAIERGARTVVVAAEGSPLVELAIAANIPWVPVPSGRPPRANLWALSVPLLVAADALGVVDAEPARLEAVADLLDGLAVECAPTVSIDQNPAKKLAAELVGTLPMIWGSSDLAGIAAYRLLCQLAENAKYPAVNGVLPEALHNQVVTFSAPTASGLPIRLVLLRDTVEQWEVAVAADEAEALAGECGVSVSRMVAVGEHPLERMASLCAVGDFASVYLALLGGVDPTPIPPIEVLKTRLQERQSQR
ncbi:MAG: bifunctional phosphoglucose/phosphomannose isomerase [Actinomycetia bacterium]|nr:bifunctional phosphoglucose/phosphomannose isomerase [Actinomycetes bacterium]